MNQEYTIREKLLASVGGMDRFKGSWSWRSHSPEQRAQSALDDACNVYHDGLANLSSHNATAEQVEEWTASFIRKWVAYMQAGARTANPMITGPANFPVDRNRKRMATERKRGEEFWSFAEGANHWMSRRSRSADRAALSEESKAVEHKEQRFGDVRVVYNQTLDRIQLVFPDKPSDEERAVLKKRAFRWSPREGAWQRKLTQNGVWAAKNVLNELGLLVDKTEPTNEQA